MNTLPPHTRYLIIGAGIHGLSTAWHLAQELKARGRGSGADILVIDKTGVGAGASGIACGVIRNFYYQPAMGEVMRLSVEIWEAHAEALAITRWVMSPSLGPSSRATSKRSSSGSSAAAIVPT
jgi:glycine/D-amino acid oxidase-like deaminating enzyme